LIKHRDEWAGELDITEFAPKSVKSDGNFEDILAADRPDVWVSHRPAKGGEAGEMLAKIIERAAALKAGKTKEADAGSQAPASDATGRREAPRSAARKRAATGAARTARKPAARRKPAPSATRVKKNAAPAAKKSRSPSS
jgi:hypothetical protein